MKAGSTDMGWIFISYAREDAEAANRLYYDLKRSGLEPWLGTKDLLPGQEWESTIRASSHFLALISSSSVTKRGFVQKEVRQGLDVLSETSPGSVFVIPIRLEEIEPQHDSLNRLQWVDLFAGYDEALTRILSSISLAQKGEATTRRQGAMTGKKTKNPRYGAQNQITVTVESRYQAQSFDILKSKRDSLWLLVKDACELMNLEREAATGAPKPFQIRWVLVETDAHEAWRDLPRKEQQRAVALLRTDDGLQVISDEDVRLGDAGVHDGQVFNLYPIEDIRQVPPPAAAPAPTPTSRSWSKIAVVIAAVIAVINIFVVYPESRLSPSPKQIDLDSCFSVGLLSGVPAAKTIIRFPGEVVALSEDHIEALSYSLNMLQYSASERYLSSLQEAAELADRSREVRNIYAVFDKLAPLKAQLEKFLRDKYGNRCVSAFQLAINVPYVRRAVTLINELDRFRKQGDLSDEVYKEQLSTAIKGIEPQMASFRRAAVSNDFDYNPRIRDSIRSIVGAKIQAAEGRKEIWGSLKSIAFEFHLNLGDEYSIVAAWPSTLGDR